MSDRNTEDIIGALKEMIEAQSGGVVTTTEERVQSLSPSRRSGPVPKNGFSVREPSAL